MKKYLITYKGNVQPQDGQKHMQDWMNWAQGLGGAMIEPGLPVQPSITISASEVKDTTSNDPICGMSMIQAKNKAAALELVQPCPHLKLGGTIELAEAIDMPMN